MFNQYKVVMWLWVDLEMTGLNDSFDVILEIAAIKTDEQLQSIGEPFESVVYQSSDVLDAMNDWCQVQHRKSGLIGRVENATESIEEIEARILTWLGDVPSGSIILCGNSIHTDRLFIRRQMPLLFEKLHYRMIDVTSFKLCIEAWQARSVFRSKLVDHRALSDIQASIDELKHYKQLMS